MKQTNNYCLFRKLVATFIGFLVLIALLTLNKSKDRYVVKTSTTLRSSELFNRSKGGFFSKVKMKFRHETYDLSK